MATELTSFGIDLSNLKTFAEQLKKLEPRLARRLRDNLAEAGETVAERARGLAAEHSTSIPPTIKTRVRGVNVYVSAGSAAVPLAGLYEVGNASGRRVRSGSGTFRHPVFGNKDVWVDQPGFPFLRRALEEVEPLLVERVRFGVDSVIRDVMRSA